MRIALSLLAAVASLAAQGVQPRELLSETWGEAHGGGTIRATPEGRVFAAPKPNAGVSGVLKVGDDWAAVELSCEYRAKDVVPGEKFYSNARILQNFCGANGKKVGPWPNTLGVEGTTDGWRRFKATYRVPDGAKTYRLDFGNIAKSGSVEYRNASVKLVRTKADLLPHDEPLPEGFAGNPFALDDAWRQETPTRTRICLNGLWRARQVATNDAPGRVPAVGDCWGWMKVPHVWDSRDQVSRLSPWFGDNGVGTVKEARWLRRTVRIPAAAADRRVVLTFTTLNSKAVVYVDGRAAATVTFPGGEADVTAAVRPGAEHEIALFVTAWPANWEKWTFDGAPDERSAKSTDHAVKKEVTAKGVTGDLYLDLVPKGNRIVEAYAECDVATREIAFFAKTERPLAEGAVLSAEVEGRGGRFSFEGPFGKRHAARGLEAWDPDRPGRLYVCRLTLKDAAGRTVDAALPFRFGFRDVKTKGRELLLNGKAVHLRGLYNVSWTRGAEVACKAACDELCRRLKDDGVNFVIAGNYAVQPGQFTYLDAFLDACDESGLLFSVTLPHVREFDWAIERDATKRARFTALTDWMISRVRNHPSVIAYAMTHNRVGYCGDINPERLDGRYEFPAETPAWVIRKQGTARFAAAIARSIDPTRPVYHHEGGNLDDFHCCNIYLNWAPVQERSEWIRDWAENGVKPLVFVEWGMPHIGTWSSYRGPLFIWTRPAFQSLWAAEFASAFRNDAAFEANTVNHAALAREEKAWAKREPFYFGRTLTDALRPWRSNFQRIQADFMNRNLPDFRAWGLTEFLPWDQAGFYERTVKRDARANPAALRGLKSPGIVPDVFPQQDQYWYDTGDRGDFAVSEVGRVWRAGNRPLLGFIGGDGLFTDRRHGYRVGEKVKKTLVLVNDKSGAERIGWSCAFGKERREGELTVAAGRTAFVPVEFTAAEAGGTELSASFRFADGTTGRDTFAVDAFPEPPSGSGAKGPVSLYDPKGMTAAHFRRLGLAFKLVDATVAVGSGGGETFVYESGAGAEQVKVRDGMKLVIGRECLTPAVMNRLVVPALRAKARILVFEQNRETLESLGFRVQEYGLRTVFPRYRDDWVPGAREASRLHDWAGEATLLKPHLDGIAAAELSYPRQMANGFCNWHVWRCGCRGNVASVIIEKPAMGDWRARADGGFNLQYSPLLDWVVEGGVATFCQLDVTARTVADPAADDLTRELVGSLARKAEPQRGAQARGMDAILACRDYGTGFNPDPLTPWNSSTLVVSSGAEKPADFEKRIREGAAALCLGLSAEEVKAWSPVPVAVAETNGCFYGRIEKLPPELNGLSNADWSWHGAMDFAAFTEPAEDGNSAFRVIRHGKGRVIFWQVPPWKIDDRAKPYLRVSRRRADAMLARLIHNLGVGSRVCGVHYLDAPVAEDDPYRYIRW